MTWLYAEVPEMGVIPHRWLGRAWRVYDRDSSVYVLMPFNVLASWLMSAWFWLRGGLDTAQDAAWAAQWQRGFEAGSRLAQDRYDDGVRVGRAAALDEIEAGLRDKGYLP
jgi:predicted NACHT family NTPase